MKSADLGLAKQNAIIEAFTQLPQYNFLWKFAEDYLPFELPANVMVKKWFRQNDVLSHPNIKLFVTHGGSMSTYETTWYGVPTIGIPFIVDQYTVIPNSISTTQADIQISHFLECSQICGCRSIRDVTY